MDEKRIQELVCVYLDIKPEQVMSLRSPEEGWITVVVNRGGAGCPKHWIKQADLEELARSEGPAGGEEIGPPKVPPKSRGKRRGSK